jgi:hypothetical protein
VYKFFRAYFPLDGIAVVVITKRCDFDRAVLMYLCTIISTRGKLVELVMANNNVGWCGADSPINYLSTC